MSMPQTEWSRRVAEIGAMAGWRASIIAEILRRTGLFALGYMDRGESNPAVVAAIRQLAADWLAAEGVVASRWRTGTPEKRGPYWCELKPGRVPRQLDWNGEAWLGFSNRGLQAYHADEIVRWQELDGIDYEVSHE